MLSLGHLVELETTERNGISRTKAWNIRDKEVSPYFRASKGVLLEMRFLCGTAMTRAHVGDALLDHCLCTDDVSLDVMSHC